MSYRTKVLLSITCTVAVAVWLVAWVISTRLTQLYEKREAQRATNLIDDFQKEFRRRGAEIGSRVVAVASSYDVARMATQLADPSADPAPYVNDAEVFAREQSLPLLEIVGPDGAIISSAQWPARFGYREDWLLRRGDWNSLPVFIRQEQLPQGPVLALMSVRTIRSGDRQLYVAGGIPLDQSFLSTLAVPEGMRVMLFRGAEDQPGLANDLVKLGEYAHSTGSEQTRVVRTTAGEEVATAIPLAGIDNQVRAVLLAIQNRSELVGLKRAVSRAAMFVSIAAVAFGLLLGFWVASRVTRPVRHLAASVREVAAGDWNTRAEVESRDEIGQLARDFNLMAAQLAEQQNRMLQAERVAAWRELARRLAHELKNPLFPMQITVENLRRSRNAPPAEFKEVFEESTTTLLAELDNLKTIVGRFGDFARMPAPHFERVDLNEIVRESMRLFQSQVESATASGVMTQLELAPHLPSVQADPEQLRRALRNLALNALDAMPGGGMLTVRTAMSDSRIVLEVSDTGEGITPEERARLFTPYYTTKQHGTGLGLAIVQSVVSDHGGTITVDSEPGRGSTFRIELKP